MGQRSFLLPSLLSLGQFLPCQDAQLNGHLFEVVPEFINARRLALKSLGGLRALCLARFDV